MQPKICTEAESGFRNGAETLFLKVACVPIDRRLIHFEEFINCMSREYEGVGVGTVRVKIWLISSK